MLWIEKYRPTYIENIISQNNIKIILNGFIKNLNIPNLIFYGASGTGKTSAIYACINELKKKNINVNVLELNASNQRGIDTVRKKIKEFSNTKSFFKNTIKIIILDEADYMTKVAQFALRRIIEKYSNNVRFCITCNYINKIISAIKSRCINIRFSLLSNKDMFNRLKNICELENIKNITENSLNLLVNLSNGDMRKAINILQNIHLISEKITKTTILNYFNYPTKEIIDNILKILLSKDDLKKKYKNIKKICHYKFFIKDIIIMIVEKIFKNYKNYKNLINIDIFYKLANLHYNINLCEDFELKLYTFISIF